MQLLTLGGIGVAAGGGYYGYEHAAQKEEKDSPFVSNYLVFGFDNQPSINVSPSSTVEKPSIAPTTPTPTVEVKEGTYDELKELLYALPTNITTSNNNLVSVGLNFGIKNGAVNRSKRNAQGEIIEKGRIDSHIYDINTQQTHRNLLALLVTLGNFAKSNGLMIPISCLKSDHKVNGGYHPKGQGVDFAYMSKDNTGMKVYELLYKEYKKLKVSQIIWGGIPQVEGIDSKKRCIGHSVRKGEVFGYPVNCDSFYAGDIAAHYNHIHVAVHNR